MKIFVEGYSARARILYYIHEEQGKSVVADWLTQIEQRSFSSEKELRIQSRRMQINKRIQQGAQADLITLVASSSSSSSTSRHTENSKRSRKFRATLLCIRRYCKRALAALAPPASFLHYIMQVNYIYFSLELSHFLVQPIELCYYLRPRAFLLFK